MKILKRAHFHIPIIILSGDTNKFYLNKIDIIITASKYLFRWLKETTEFPNPDSEVWFDNLKNEKIDRGKIEKARQDYIEIGAANLYDYLIFYLQVTHMNYR